MKTAPFPSQTENSLPPISWYFPRNFLMDVTKFYWNIRNVENWKKKVKIFLHFEHGAYHCHLVHKCQIFMQTMSWRCVKLRPLSYDYWLTTLPSVYGYILLRNFLQLIHLLETIFCKYMLYIVVVSCQNWFIHFVKFLPHKVYQKFHMCCKTTSWL